MKKIFALVLVAVVAICASFSIFSHQSAEDLKGMKVTSVNLEFNFYEITTYQKAEDLEAIGASTSSVSGVIYGEKEGDKVLLVYCKTEAIAKLYRSTVEQKLADFGDP